MEYMSRRIVSLMLSALCVSLVIGCSRPEKSIDAERLMRTTTRTIDGREWNLADYKGRVVLIHFWATWCKPCKAWEPWLKETHRRYGDRKDFALVGVALDRDSDTVREYCAKHGMEWLQLHESGKQWKNSLAKALGVTGVPSVWLVHKDGTIEELKDFGGQVDAALFGLTYESFGYLVPRMSAEKLPKNRVLALCGKPDRVETEGGQETWHYSLVSRDGRKVYDVTIVFDSTGRQVNCVSRHTIPAAATLTVTISDDYWNGKSSRARMPSQPLSSGIHAAALEARFEGERHMLFDPMKESLLPGKSYSIRLPPGDYDLYLRVFERPTFRTVEEIPLAVNLTLANDERKALVF